MLTCISNNNNYIGTVKLPSIYASVANLDPFSAIGCYESESGLCTPQYPYKLDTAYFGGNVEIDGEENWWPFTLEDGDDNLYLYIAIGNNPGYDPSVSGDPNYGVILYINEELVAITDLYLNSNDLIEQNLWVLNKFDSSVSMTGLSASLYSEKESDVKYVFVDHEKAQNLLKEQDETGNGKLLNIVIDLSVASKKEAMIRKFELEESKWKDIALVREISFCIVIGFILLFLMGNVTCLYCICISTIKGKPKQQKMVYAKQLDEIICAEEESEEESQEESEQELIKELIENFDDET